MGWSRYRLDRNRVSIELVRLVVRDGNGWGGFRVGWVGGLGVVGVDIASTWSI